MEDCIFCKIIEGKIPCAKVYEDNKVIGFLDISPNNKGHCLIVPKQHSTNLLDMEEEDLEATMKAARKVAQAVSKSINPDFNIIINNGKSAGQLVFHSHMHIIPRFDNDGLKFDTRHMKYAESEMQEYAEKIRNHIQ